MTARDTYNTSVANNHASAETGGVSTGVSGMPTVTGNQTTWSRQSARAALINGNVTQVQFNQIMAALSSWEEGQNSLAKATLRNGGDSFPV